MWRVLTTEFHRFRALCIASTLVFMSCAQGDPPDLADCSAEYFEDFEEMSKFSLPPEWEDLGPAWARDHEPAEISRAERQRALQIAAAWAVEYCYLPCEYEMCGVLKKGPQGNVVVYLRPRTPFFVSPEADVLVNLESSSSVDARRYHTGCALRTGECEVP